MRVLLAFAGSRGDAQPGVLLGRELANRGHRVTVAVSPNLVEFAAAHGVSAVPFGLDSAELLRAQHTDHRFTAWNPLERVRALLDLQRRGFAEAARDLLEISGETDLLVTGMACEEVAAEVARQRSLPSAAMHFFPILPNRAVPVVPAAWGRRVPGALNLLGWQALTRTRAWALAPEIAALRRATELVAGQSAAAGLKPLVSTAIQAYDIELFPGLAPALGDAPVTGFPVVPGIGGEESDPSFAPAGGSSGADGAGRARVGRDLAEWLLTGEPPVYAGFGSMPMTDPLEVERMVREVCRRQGRRLLLAGSMFRADISPEVAVVAQLDHRAVLPLCAVAIHHGGAGTTAAALRAGVPSVICSVQADQPFWGRQLESLGLGATLPFAHLTADRLEQLLIRATDPTVVLRASAYGMRFRDDGVARAATVVESLAPPDRPAPLPSIPVTTLEIGGDR
ncbi:nucleotide disphospho-sugar-binding domain-containing protein [Nocardia sp. NPDC006630]|uniref:glycosyltransferase n=1 Tax=Nocardia sp. NPDC006630 TaxID=3157181 RepID=UPI00339F3B35